MSKNVKRLIPFAILIVLILIVYLTNVHDVLSISSLQKEKNLLTSYAKAHPFFSALIYLVIYIASVALVLPDSVILTLLGGMVFPQAEALILATISETIGSTIFFAIFYTTFGAPILKKEHIFITSLRKKFENNKVSYLLFLRISHFVPFWLTNIAAAYFRVKYWTFIWTTFVGVLPITYIIANAGRSLSKAFDEHRIMTISDIFTPQVKLALLILGLLALCPIIFKKFIHKRWKH